MPSWGKFSDIWGRKPVLLAAAVLFMIGSVLCAAANGIELMLLGRIIQGLGAGGQLSLVNVTISDIVTMRYVFSALMIKLEFSSLMVGVL